MLSKRLWILAFLLCAAAASAQAPALFYSDLISGPATGGPGGNGAFVCGFGEYFGATQGGSTVTIGGVAQHVVTWTDAGGPYNAGSYAKVCFQVDSATPAGLNSIIVTTSGGSSPTYPCSSIPTDPGYDPANPGTYDPVNFPPNATYTQSRYVYPCFTVSAGNLYFMGPGGSDSNPGTFGSPFLTTAKAMTTMTGGDIAYGLDGIVEQTNQGGSKASINFSNTTGSWGAPITVACYPGATCTGISTTANTTSRVVFNYTGIAGGTSHWVMSGWHLYSTGTGGNAISIVGSFGASLPGNVDIRLSNNDAECQATSLACDFDSATLLGGIQQYLYVLGNYVHNSGCFEQLPDYVNTTHPCPWNATSTTFTSSGTSLTYSSGSGVPVIGDVIQRLDTGEQREVVALITPFTVVRIDSPFTVDALTPTGFKFRDFAPNKTFHNIYYSAESFHLWVAYNHVDGSGGRANRGIQTFSTPGLVQQTIVPSTASVASTVTNTTGEGFTPNFTGSWTLQVPGNSSFVVNIGTQQTSTQVAATLNANSTFSGAPNSLVATAPNSTSFVVTGHTGASGSQTLIASKTIYGAGASNYDQHIFQNFITDTYGDCINIAVSDPAKGVVEAFNNTLVRCGVEHWWFPPGGAGGQACVFAQQVANTAYGYAAGAGTVEVYNNSCMDWGYTRCSTTSCATPATAGFLGGWGIGPGTASNVVVRLRNNVLAGLNNFGPYFAVNGSQNSGGLCTGTTTNVNCTGPSTHNLYYGNGNGPANTASNTNANPLFSNAATNNLRIQAASPAIAAGITGAAVQDADGFTRPNPPADGAFEYYAGPSFPLTVTSAGSGSVAMSGLCVTGNVTAGATVTCTAVPSPGNSLSAWSGTCGLTGSSTSASFTMPGGNCTVIATFAVNNYTLTVDTPTHGTITNTSNCATGSLAFGTSITCTATPAGGYLLQGWVGCDQAGIANPLTYAMPAGDCDINAVFALPATPTPVTMLLGIN